MTIDYWSYRESLERSGHILWLPMAEQARFVDGIAAKFSGNVEFCLGQLRHCQSDRDFKNWNASGIGSLAFMALFGPEEQMEAWRECHSRIVGTLKKGFDVSAETQQEWERSTVDHPSFPPVTQEAVARIRQDSKDE